MYLLLRKASTEKKQWGENALLKVELRIPFTLNSLLGPSCPKQIIFFTNRYICCQCSIRCCVSTLYNYVLCKFLMVSLSVGCVICLHTVFCSKKSILSHLHNVELLKILISENQGIIGSRANWCMWPYCSKSARESTVKYKSA